MCKGALVVVVTSLLALAVHCQTTSVSSGYFLMPSSCGEISDGRKRVPASSLVVQSELWLKTHQPADLQDDTTGNKCHLSSNTTFMVRRDKSILQVKDVDDDNKQVCNFSRDANIKLLDNQVYTSCHSDRESAEKEMSTHPDTWPVPPSGLAYSEAPVANQPPLDNSTQVMNSPTATPYSTTRVMVTTVAETMSQTDFITGSLTKAPKSFKTTMESLIKAPRNSKTKMEYPTKAPRNYETSMEYPTKAPRNFETTAVTSTKTPRNFETTAVTSTKTPRNFETTMGYPTKIPIKFETTTETLTKAKKSPDLKVKTTNKPSTVKLTDITTQTSEVTDILTTQQKETITETLTQASGNPSMEIISEPLITAGVKTTGIVNLIEITSEATQTIYLPSNNSSHYNKHPKNTLPYFIGAGAVVTVVIILIVVTICIARRQMPESKHEINKEEFFIGGTYDNPEPELGYVYNNAQNMYSGCDPEVEESFELEKRILKSQSSSPEAETPKCLRSQETQNILP
ncbi:cell wall integrity and stress response component 4-like [Homarus americanus]|uniref:Uncharacterized protein n=1 Tax=Homarus americanus TaxID=6706 RepID=A0A8J5JPN6_HOMAM|nr:cell wall integrity and stress response component 4-like [Homarus americanus]KAG7160068.1 hypothetical protein Hamer_G023154 [Homarus americanus]